MVSQKQIEDAKSDIAHRCDGPVTDFVMVSRAVALAADGKHDREAVANALYELLGLEE